MKRGLLLLVAVGLMAVSGQAQSLKDLLNSQVVKDVVSSVTGGRTLSAGNLAGTWKYVNPALQLKSGKVLTNVAGTAATSEVEEKLKDFLAKVGIEEGLFGYTFQADSTFTSDLKRVKLKGTYEVHEAEGTVTLKYKAAKWNVLSLTGDVVLTGSRLTLLFQADKLLDFLTKVSSISNGKAMSAVNKLATTYDGLMLGFDLDKDRARIKSEIGIVFQKSVLDPRLTVRENLTTRAALYGIYGGALKRKLGELTEMLNLYEFMNRQYGKLSGGQKRRVDIARGLINSPELLILDEPTTGLDPQTRRSVWETVDTLMKKYDMTVFLTTHYMEEAGGADDVVIIDTGKVIAHGTPNELKNLYSGIYLKAYRFDNALAKAISERYGAELVYDQLCVSFKLKDMAVAAKIIAEYKDELVDFEVLKGDMDDVFLNVTGKKLEGGANG